MRRLVFDVLSILLLFIYSQNAFAQIYDSFSDGDFTNSPVWSGDTGSWSVVQNATSGPNATNSQTLRLNAPSGGSSTDYLSSQRSGSWSAQQAWGFWLGRRAGSSGTTQNQSIVWLWANEGDFTSATVDGYRVRFGDNSGNDQIFLERVDNGGVTTILTSSGAVLNGLADIGFLVRVTRSSSSLWTLYTSFLPASNGEKFGADAIPDQTNTPVNQGSVTDATYTIFDGGFLGVEAVHSTGATARQGAEFDQFYFSTTGDLSLPVTFASFTASAGDGKVVLRWVTESELNNLGFEVYRAEAPDDNYQLLSSYLSDPALQGQGNSNSRHSYSFTDPSVVNGTTYWYKLTDVDANGNRTFHGPVNATPNARAANIHLADPSLPHKFEMYPNYPNPFNPTTRIRFDLPASSTKLHRVSLKVYNLLGQEVAELFDGELDAGSYEVLWDGRTRNGLPAAAGAYIAVLHSDYLTKAIKMVLLK